MATKKSQQSKQEKQQNQTQKQDQQQQGQQQNKQQGQTQQQNQQQGQAQQQQTGSNQSSNQAGSQTSVATSTANTGTGGVISPTPYTPDDSAQTQSAQSATNNQSGQPTSTSGTPQPQGTTSATSQPQGTAAGAPQPQGAATGTPQPQGAAVGTPQPQGTTSGTSQPQGFDPTAGVARFSKNRKAISLSRDEYLLPYQIETGQGEVYRPVYNSQTGELAYYRGNEREPAIVYSGQDAIAEMTRVLFNNEDPNITGPQFNSTMFDATVPIRWSTVTADISDADIAGLAKNTAQNYLQEALEQINNSDLPEQVKENYRQRAVARAAEIENLAIAKYQYERESQRLHNQVLSGQMTEEEMKARLQDFQAQLKGNFGSLSASFSAPDFSFESQQFFPTSDRYSYAESSMGGIIGRTDPIMETPEDVKAQMGIPGAKTYWGGPKYVGLLPLSRASATKPTALPLYMPKRQEKGGSWSIAASQPQPRIPSGSPGSTVTKNAGGDLSYGDIGGNVVATTAPATDIIQGSAQIGTYGAAMAAPFDKSIQGQQRDAVLTGSADVISGVFDKDVPPDKLKDSTQFAKFFIDEITTPNTKANYYATQYLRGVFSLFEQPPTVQKLLQVADKAAFGAVSMLFDAMLQLTSSGALMRSSFQQLAGKLKDPQVIQNILNELKQGKSDTFTKLYTEIVGKRREDWVKARENEIDKDETLSDEKKQELKNNLPQVADKMFYQFTQKDMLYGMLKLMSIMPGNSLPVTNIQTSPQQNLRIQRGWKTMVRNGYGGSPNAFNGLDHLWQSYPYAIRTVCGIMNTGLALINAQAHLTK